ncbi:PA2169 family four-helix-bundle protein [Brevundimonas vesicularis]|uniref:PA2169 family four-helix-bundle protein n=1 Tax=Brevundimonas vesicularis TaxID=41276 RepID=UPI0038D42C24
MAQANSHDVKVLRDLAQHLSDSASGYHDAAEEAQNTRYGPWFEARAAERRAMAQNLRVEVTQRGGRLEEDGSILAKAQRAFTDIKHALLRRDASVIDAVESSEDGLKTRFQSAIDDQSLSATTRETIRRCHAQILAVHDQMSALKHGLESQRDADNPLYPR